MLEKSLRATRRNNVRDSSYLKVFTTCAPYWRLVQIVAITNMKVKIMRYERIKRPSNHHFSFYKPYHNNAVLSFGLAKFCRFGLISRVLGDLLFIYKISCLSKLPVDSTVFSKRAFLFLIFVITLLSFGF